MLITHQQGWHLSHLLFEEPESWNTASAPLTKLGTPPELPSLTLFLTLSMWLGFPQPGGGKWERILYLEWGQSLQGAANPQRGTWRKSRLYTQNVLLCTRSTRWASIYLFYINIALFPSSFINTLGLQASSRCAFEPQTASTEIKFTVHIQTRSGHAFEESEWVSSFSIWTSHFMLRVFP